MDPAQILLLGVGVLVYTLLFEALLGGRPCPTMLVRVLIGCLPLIGLLGTVGGMITSFQALAEAPAGTGLSSQAGTGVAQALRATQHGLLLAIPALLLEGLVARRRMP